MKASGVKLSATALAQGSAEGSILVLDEPLSFWGGFDAVTGRICDQNHPQAGLLVRGKILVMPSGRGSSSASSILAESIRRDTGPKAIILKEADAILALGSIVAAELYQKIRPVIVIHKESDWIKIVKCNHLSVTAELDKANLLLY